VSVAHDVITVNDLNTLTADLPATAPRSTLWARVLEALTPHHAHRVQVIERQPDALAVVADTHPAPAIDAELPDPTALQACLQRREPTFAPLDEAQAGEAGVVALLPLLERGAATALLRIERREPLEPGDAERLRLLAFALSARLTERSWALETRLITQLSTRLAAIDELQAGAAAALSLIVPALGASAGLVLEARGGRLVSLADYGEKAIARRQLLSQGIPLAAGLTRQVFETGSPRFTRAYQHHPERLQDLPIDPVVLITPLDHRGTTRKALVLTYPQDTIPARADLTLLRGVTRVLAAALDGLRERYAQEHLGALLEAASTQPLSALYQIALETALKSVPGAERASLLARDAPSEDFTYRAATGYDLNRLSGLTIPEERLRGWYAPTATDWGAGAPRVARASTTNLARTAWLAGITPTIDKHDKLKALKTNLCLPIIEDGWVRAVLNLDSTLREDAFVLDSLRIAHQVAIVTTIALRTASDRATLQAAALTDPVTGLPNRRAFELELERALARAARDGQPLAVLVLDMNGFKHVNDTLGHAKGDDALRLVAHTLKRNLRGGDVIARWGGDEFLALLPRQNAQDAQHTARRLTHAVNPMSVDGHRLAIDIGAAAYPTDATTAHDLLTLADARMYRQKRPHPAGG